MFDDLLRAFKDRLLAPLAHAVGTRLHPNAITVGALVLGLMAATAAAQAQFALGLALWIANRLVDGFDGTLARVTGMQSDFGGYLDLVLDFVVYAVVLIGLVLGAPPPPARLPALVLIASFYVNAASWMYLAALLERRAAGFPPPRATSVVMPRGLVGGAETFVFYVLFFLFPGRLSLLFGVMAAGVGISIVQRVGVARRVLHGGG